MWGDAWVVSACVRYVYKREEEDSKKKTEKIRYSNKGEESSNAKILKTHHTILPPGCTSSLPRSFFAVITLASLAAFINARAS